MHRDSILLERDASAFISKIVLQLRGKQERAASIFRAPKPCIFRQEILPKRWCVPTYNFVLHNNRAHPHQHHSPGNTELPMVRQKFHRLLERTVSTCAPGQINKRRMYLQSRPLSTCHVHVMRSVCKQCRAVLLPVQINYFSFGYV